jgi:outer membrane receptor protein involved in Fe transport
LQEGKCARAATPVLLGLRSEPSRSVGRIKGGKMISRRSLVGLTMGLIVNLTSSAWGASSGIPSRGRIAGRVKDALDRPIEGAHIGLQAADGTIAAETESGEDGRFVIDGVAPGTYAIQGSKQGFETGTVIVTIGAGRTSAPELVLASKTALNVKVAAQKLNEARNKILVRTGSSAYDVSKTAIQVQPQGASAPLNQTLLRAPGVTQDSFGQIHVRGDHANLQFRLNGVYLPEGINRFGQIFGSRFIEQLSLLDGALPAQYGIRTAAVLDMQTKSGTDVSGTTVDFYGGSYNHARPSFEVGGTSGSTSYYATAQYLYNEQGIENPTGSVYPLHDNTNQGNGLIYVSHLLDPTTRLSLIAGSTVSAYQIPNVPGEIPTFWVDGLPPPSSSDVNERQSQQNYFGVLALQKSMDKLDYQVAGFAQYSRTLFLPDTNSDLAFNGVASKVDLRSFAIGVQGDASYRLGDSHTLRGGFFYQNEHTLSRTWAHVFPVDAAGMQSSTIPFIIDYGNSKLGNILGFYLQDEWKITSKLTLNYGARYDHLQAFRVEGQLSPRVNAVYKPFEKTTLHAGYARYFTPPPQIMSASPPIAKFEGTTNEPEVKINSAPRSERSDYYDVGVIQEVLPGLQLGLDSYYKISHQLLDEGQFGAALIDTSFNYAWGHIWGVEFTESYQRGGLTTYANVAYNSAKGRRITSAQFEFGPDELDYIRGHDVHLDHEQYWTGSGGASYLWRGTRVGVDLLFGSGLRRGNFNTDKLPSYSQVDFSLSHKFDRGRLKGVGLRFDLINVCDQIYQIRDGSGIGVGASQFGPQRAFYGGISKDF